MVGINTLELRRKCALLLHYYLLLNNRVDNPTALARCSLSAPDQRRRLRKPRLFAAPLVRTQTARTKTKQEDKNEKDKEEMKESKAVYVTKHKIRDDQNFVYQIYAKHNREYTDRYDTSNFGCQYDSKKDNVICTCRNISSKRPQDMRYFSGIPKQIYAYHGSRSFTDVGVGSVKVLQRRKIKRIYLPETDDRGVGSSDLSSFVIRKIKQQKGSYYDHKKTSSKCVGGILEYNTGCVISEKLSPIIHTKSGTTSTKASTDIYKHTEIGSNTVDKNLVTTGTQFEIESKKSEELKEEKVKINRETEVTKKTVIKVSEQTQKNKYSTEIQGNKISMIERKAKEVEKVYSSDSLVQHVHNLENPSCYEKPSRTSIDPMENKLEREYRRMFSTKDRDSKQSVDKPIPEFKSASILRRRFESLRRGLVKMEDGKKNTVPSSQDSIPSRKDASVTSDPPSLEGRSFIDTKKYSPLQANVGQDNNKINYKSVRDSVQWPQSDNGSEYQGVKGMFKLWGKKFNFDDDTEKPRTTPMPSLAIDINRKPKESQANKLNESKKSGRKFFFFKKKSKDKKIEKPKEIEKEQYNPSGVTAGRCEIADGLTLKIGNTPPKDPIVSKISEEGDEIKRRTWLKKFLANTIESARSVNVRWNNSMYATSSSTVFELMDTIYKNNGVVLKSRSEITTEESSYYRSYTKNKVNFDQKIEAWMVPKTIPDSPGEIPVKIQSNKELKERNIEVTISDQRWFIEKSRAFANKIEVVLHSKNFNKVNKKVSSDYLRIDIPKDFFDVLSSDDSKQTPTSDEEVYKIVEYESDLYTKKPLNNGDHASNDIKVIVSVQDSKNMEAKILETVIKRPPMHRDVVIQGSNVNIPKRCDVIGVGIITQRDMRDIRKPILKIQDDLTDDDSEENIQTNQKKCEFAESYLQEYYRHWTPLGIDLFSWCVSDSHLRSSSEKSLISFHNQGDGSKSCPNICDDFQTSAIVSSCNTSSCSQCAFDNVCQKPDCSFSSKLFKKFKKPSKAKTDTDIASKRVLPKDSLEVFKRRKIYANSLKSKWACSEDKPVSVPSIESKGAQDTLVECPKFDKSIFKTTKLKNKPCKKHVSMPDCDALAKQLCDKMPEGILAFKGQAGCDACKNKGMKCPKHTVVKAKPICEIPQPPCKVSCDKIKKPACEKPNSPSCNVSSVESLKETLCKIPQLLGSPVFPKKPTCQQCIPPIPSCNPCCPGSPPPPCPASLPPCLQSRPRRNALCSPPISQNGSRGPSPKTSHDCPNPAQSLSPQKKKYARRSSPQRNEKRCPKCQNKQPCPKFPDCKLLSSESSGSSSSGSPQRSPKECSGSPQLSPKKSPPGMILKNKAHGPKKKQQPKVSPCNLPPCSKIKKACKTPPKSPCESNEFPWPINNQISNPPSPSCSETSQQKANKNKCKTKCSMLPKTSGQSLAPNKVKQCKPDCANANRKKKPECPEKQQLPCPAKQHQQCLEPPPQKRSFIETSKMKISGLFLKMKPSKKKTCSTECLAWETQGEERGVVRLNSREKITISMKQETPSTEEIREGMNVKVQDDDGNTLFERKDYTCNQTGHKASVLGDMYKDSKINRVSTPVMIVTNDVATNNQGQEAAEFKSDASLSNLIEIQFKLRITQGDKTTEINIGNEDEVQDKGNEINKTSHEVFVVENEDKEPVEDVSPKNDINIKIVVKNYKPKSNKNKHPKKYDDEFTKKISEKFHTVSTGYSDILTNQNDDNVFSIHRATVDLNSSEEKFKKFSKPSNELVSEELSEPINFMVSSHSTEHLATDITEDENVEKSVSSKKYTQSYDKYDYINDLETKDLDTDQDATLETNTSNECNDMKFNATEEKKQLLKKVFEKSHTKPKNKENVRELRDILKIILTDSSDNDEINTMSNELAKDVTYTSLKPDYFRNTDSMNNYYQIESSLTIEEIKETSNIHYPTVDNNSTTSGTSKCLKPQGCMCSRVAESLNCDLKIGCCCKKQSKIDEITSCDIRNEQDLYLLNYRTTEYVDVHTQNSKLLSDNSNSMNLSIKSRERHSVQNETDTINMKENTANTKESNKTEKHTPNTFPSHKNYMKEGEKKKLNRNTILGISDDDKIVLLSEEATRKTYKKKEKEKAVNNNNNLFKTADVLQCYETKKAVLEIYAEKTVSENGEHFVAKLPKFVCEKESEITRNYEKIATNSYKSVCRRNVVRMSVQR